MVEVAMIGPDWMPDFLAELKTGTTVEKAAQGAGITYGTAYFQRRTNAAFAAAWEEARAEAAANTACGQPSRNAGWKVHFLDKLAETSNVSASAAHANTPLPTVYRLRREDPEFAENWQAALFEGYASLEMELLGYLRDPAPERKMDVAGALRLLGAHKEAIARQRAQRANVNAAEVRASIERKVQAFRQQVAADRKRVRK